MPAAFLYSVWRSLFAALPLPPCANTVYLQLLDTWKQESIPHCQAPCRFDRRAPPMCFCERTNNVHFPATSSSMTQVKCMRLTHSACLYIHPTPPKMVSHMRIFPSTCGCNESSRSELLHPSTIYYSPIPYTLYHETAVHCSWNAQQTRWHLLHTCAQNGMEVFAGGEKI